MSVTKKIRAKVASSISRIEETESFLWIAVLRAGELDYREIDIFIPELWPTDNINLRIYPPDLTLTTAFSFNKVKTLRLAQKRLILKSKINPVFFGFGNISVSNIDISFENKLKQYFAVKIIVDGTPAYFRIKDQITKEVSGKITASIVNTEHQLHNAVKYFNDGKTNLFGNKKDDAKVVNYVIKEPEITDCLSRLRPRIYNIELLSRLDQTASVDPSTSKKIDLLDKSISINRIDEKELKFNQELIFSPFEFSSQISYGGLNVRSDLFPWTARQINIKIPEFKDRGKTKLSVFYESNPSQPVTNEKSTKAILAKNINKIIQPKMDLSPEEENKFFEKLYPFQVQGVKSLSNNERVLFSNEPGLGKTVQAIFAIKYLIKKREIKTALVVTNDFSAGSIDINEKTGSNYGWTGALHRFAAELSFNNIASDITDINNELDKDFQIQIITYEMLSRAVTKNLLKKGTLKKFDCLIFDEAEHLKDQKEFAKFIDLIKPKFKWIITSLAKEEFIDNISPVQNPAAFINHSFDEIEQQLPDIIESNYWVDLEKEHQNELQQTLFLAKNSLQDIQATGNPFRFQSQLFFYIHQLNQVCNFSMDNIESNKTRLLLSHAKALKSHNKKVLIISQYDKAGIQKLAKLLEGENISYKRFSQGMNPAELSKAVSEFENDDSITAFLADSQIFKSKSQVVYAPFIIHFDQWWSPISKWDLENKIKSKAKKPIIALNYFTKDTLEENIQSVLFSKGLLDRKNFGNIGADAYSKLLSEEDWSNIFGLEKISKPTTGEKASDDTPEKI